MGCAQLSLVGRVSVGHPPEKRHLHGEARQAQVTVGWLVSRYETLTSVGSGPRT